MSNFIDIDRYRLGAKNMAAVYLSYSNKSLILIEKITKNQ